MKSILWDSRNHPLKSQLKELRRLFGEDVQVDVYDKSYTRPSDVLKIYKQKPYDEMVIIAPLSICRQIVGYGYKPLYAEMETATPENYEVEVFNSREKNEGHPRYYRFVKFKNRKNRIHLF